MESTDITHLFDEYTQKYGKVFTIYFGSTPVVVLNDLDSIREALTTKSVDYAGRPPSTFGKNLLLHVFSCYPM